MTGVTLSAVALTMLSAPQIWDGGHAAIETPRPVASPAVGHGTDDIRESIRDGRRSGQLDRREARSLRREARAIDAIGARLARDGLTESEAREIAFRTEALRGLVKARRLNGD